MSSRAHALACHSQHSRRTWLGWVILASLTSVIAGSISAAHGQGNLAVSDAVPPAAPAEIQPQHPGTGNPAIVAPGTEGSGPQTAAPAPLPPGSGSDTPGGSARNGIITPPPASGDPGINKGAPSTGTMPVIPPPGARGGNQQVVPK